MAFFVIRVKNEKAVHKLLTKLKSGVYYIKLFYRHLSLSTCGLYYKHITIVNNDRDTTIWNFTLGAYLMT